MEKKVQRTTRQVNKIKFDNQVIYHLQTNIYGIELSIEFFFRIIVSIFSIILIKMFIDQFCNSFHGKQFIRPQDCKLRQYYHAFFGTKLKLNFSFMQLNMLILHLLKFAKVQLCNKFAAYVSFSKRLVIRNFQNQRLYFINSRRFLGIK